MWLLKYHYIVVVFFHVLTYKIMLMPYIKNNINKDEKTLI
jgi:hypothetical protein